MPTYTVAEIAEKIGGRLEGAPDVRIEGLEAFEYAHAGHLTLIGEKKYTLLWAASAARAAIIDEKLALAPGAGRALIRAGNPDVAMAAAQELFSPPPLARPPGIHPSAVVDPAAKLGRDVHIGPGCVIGPGARIGDRCVLYANVTVMDETALGADCMLWPGVVLRERCLVGAHCIFQPNANIGADGFGYRPAPDGRSLLKIPQTGIVIIGDHVEIGAGACVDRARFSATVIGDHTKIDNLVQIGHNCRLGRMVCIAGLSGISGSVTIGDGVLMGGNVGIADHMQIGAGARLGARSGVMRDIPPGLTVFGLPAKDIRQALRELAAIEKLPELLKKLAVSQKDRPV